MVDNMRIIILTTFFMMACTSTTHLKNKPNKSSITHENRSNRAQCKVSKPTKNTIKLKKIGSEHSDAFKNKFDFSFVDIGLREALMDLSEQSGIPIAIGEEVTGIISLSVKKRNFHDCLQMIVSSGPYDYKYFDSGYYYVGLSDPDSPSWSKLAHSYQYRARSLLPSKVVEMINDEFKPYVKGDDKLRMISIFAPKSKLSQILNMVQELDQAPRQITLQMTISEISSAGREVLGRNNLTESAVDTLTGFSPVLNLQHPIVLKPTEYSQLMKSISFIEQNGQGEIRAQPALTVLEGEEAVVKTNTQIMIQDKLNTSAKPTFLNSEVGFSVIPRLTDNNDIILNIVKATAGDINKKSATDAELSEQSITTTVRVNAGDSLILGGMFYEKQITVVTQVPYIGSIPMIGWFFKNKAENKEKMEVIFAIKPQVSCSNI